MATPVRFRVEVDNGQAVRSLGEAERRLQGFDAAVSRAATSSRQATFGFRGLTRETRNQGRAFGEAVNLTSELGLGFAALGPKAREVSVQFAGAGNNAVILGNALGPLGVVVGVVATAIPILITEIVNLASEAEEAAASVDLLTVSFDQARTKLGQLNAARARQSRRDTGSEGTEEASAFRLSRQASFREEAFSLQRELQAAGISGEGALAIVSDRTRATAVRRLEAGVRQALVGEDPSQTEAVLSRLTSRVSALAEARNELAVAVQAEAAAREENSAAALEEAEANLPTEVDRGRRGRGRRGRGPRVDRDAFNLADFESELRREEQANLSLQIDEPEAVRLENERQIAEVLAEQLELKKAQDDLEADLAQRGRAKAAQEAALFKVQQEEAAAEAEALREGQAIRAKTFDLVNRGTGAALEIFELNEGSKELILGASQVAQAIGSYPDGFGIAQHGISAALHFANAAKLGVGGGGGAPPIPKAPTQEPGFASGADSGGGVSVINFNAPIPEALIGREQRRAHRAYQARFGS